MKFRFSFLVFIALFSCGPQSSNVSHAEKIKSPFHKVIYLDSYYSHFINSIKSDTTGIQKKYSEIIKDAILSDHFLNTEYFEIIIESFSYPIKDTSGLLKFVSDINANKNQIETIISGAFKLCNKHLNNDSVIFYILPLNADIKKILNKMGGVSGQTAGSNKILLTIDFDNASWKEMLEYAVAHEFNHAYWTRINYSASYKWTLIRYLLFEGKADSFAHLLYPNVKAPWTIALSNKEKENLWNKIKPNLQSENPSLHGEIMFGYKNYPTWGGYTLGYDIMQAAFKNNPELLKTNWTNLEAEKLLELSGYN